MSNQTLQASPTGKKYILSSIAVGAFLSTFDGGVVNVGLPKMASEFQVSITMIQWVPSVYLLTMSALLIVFGTLADMYGRKRIYNGGYVLVAVFSLLCALTNNIYLLILTRVLQGVGGAMIMANGLAIATENYPPEQRGKNIGTLASVAAIGSLAGPALGGIVIGLWGWRWIFILNFIVATLGFTVSHFIIPADHGKGKLKKFDSWGALYVIVGMVSFIYAISNLNDFGWSSPVILISLALFLLSVIAVAIQERQATNPVLDFELFKIRIFWTSIIAALISFVTMYSSTILIPFYYQKVLGYTPQAAGLFMMAFPLGMAVMAVFAGRLSDKIGYTLLTTGGMVLNAIALILLANVGQQTPILQVLLAVFGMGASLGLFQAPNNSCIMGNVPKNKLGIATGISQLVKNLGMVLGITLSVAVFQYGMRTRTGLAYPDAFGPSAAVVYYLAAGLSVIGALFSVNRGPSKPLTANRPKT
ncbi:MAG: MFS transporter [Desulfitobacteriaceae bacterium]|nr:MFS transporter [Desulfitobacteriaceae bacterium]MDI6913156.1 MFS transporter [Desulfitobacteriaceae bacterium]